MKTTSWLYAFCMMAFAFVTGCKGTDSTAVADVHITNLNGECAAGDSSQFKITSDTLSVAVGQSKKVDYTAKCGKPSWLSNNNGVVTVNGDGHVTGVAPGTTKVYGMIQSGGISIKDSISVTVLGQTGGNQNQPSVVISSSNPLVVNTSCSATLTPIAFTVTALNGAASGVTITSTNNVGTYVLSGNSIVPTRKSPAVAGTDTITITSTAIPSVKYLVFHQVTLCNTGGTDVPPTGTDTLKLTLCGQGYTGSTTGLLQLFVNNVQVPYLEVVYQHNGNALSIAPATGVVTPVLLGTYQVLMSPKSNPLNTKTVVVIVTSTACVQIPTTGGTSPGNVTSVTVTPSTASLKIGDQTTFNATVVTANGASQAVTWTSSDGCVSVTPNGNSVTVTAIRVCPVGGAIIKATSVADVSKSGSATVTVNSVATSCTVTAPNGVTTYTVGQQATFSVTCVVPSGVTVLPWWSSSDPSRATVLGAPSVIYIGGIPWPAGPTATIKFLGKGPVTICAQPYVQDPTIKGCLTVTVN